ncbi:hypothetical protein TRAPUB_8144 [Trametes pubescens]|uniref:Uncharacterized protein n=1 Tax=Trametes pubescens TaxID=154538 RepID=A0A1M2W650_TRAPU|nr:hypothetical protein TRAPUB_8144 [Trametes pubescens]
MDQHFFKGGDERSAVASAKMPAGELQAAVFNTPAEELSILVSNVRHITHRMIGTAEHRKIAPLSRIVGGEWPLRA